MIELTPVMVALTDLLEHLQDLAEAPADDHQLVLRDDAPAHLRRRHLCQIGRDGHRGAADRQPEHEARGHHYRQVGSERARQGAEKEHCRQQQDVLAPPVTV